MQLSKARYYTTLDVRGAYNLLRVAEGEEWKTAFRTRYGLNETLVMPFGLTNAPADFQRFIDDVLHPFLDNFCTDYLDDILIYSNTLQKHRIHVKTILTALSKAGLHLKPEKCEFHRTEVAYLGIIITNEGIKMDPRKVETIVQWGSPTNLHDVRAFLGFANFYRRFIKGYSEIVTPMVRLTKKEVIYNWDKACEEAFQKLKTSFTSAPILRHFDPDLEIIVETDASDYVSAGIMSQYHNRILHPVAFFSKKHSPAEYNYEIYDKELMAIVCCFEEWRAELESTHEDHPIQVLSDHKNLEYFMSTKLLNRRQARWSEFLSRFNFKIVYRPGKASTKPDALTRRYGDLPKEGDERLKFQEQVVLKPQNLGLNAITEPTILELPKIALPNSLLELMKEGYIVDPIPNDILQQLRDGKVRSKQLSLAECKDETGRLIYRDRIYIPNHTLLKLRLIQDFHDTPAAGHPGRSKTLELLARQYYWPKMHKDVDQYLRNCHTVTEDRFL